MPYSNKDGAAIPSAVVRAKRLNMLRKQRLAAVFAAATAVLLTVVLFVVLYLVDIYSFEDVNGDEYTVKKTDGVYSLYDKSGDLCDTVEYQNKICYLTDIGTIVYVDPDSGVTEIKVIVDTYGTEVQDYGTYVLMFKRMTYDEGSVNDKSMIIESIEVRNSAGGFTFLRNDAGDFVMEGSEDAPISAESFAQLASLCGYTLSSQRLKNPVRLESGEVDLTEYGLAAETRVLEETDDSGNKVEVEYQYTPASYIITAMNGDRHEVIVGDLTVTGTGFYAKYNGGIVDGNATESKDTIYILSSSDNILNESGLGGYELLCGRAENYIVPRIVYPMGLTEYFNVSNFILYDGIDYSAIYSELYGLFGEEEYGNEEFLNEYNRLFEEYSHKVCDFTFYDMDARKGTMNMYIPYVSELDYASGYYLNSDNVDLMLYGFYATDFKEVIKLSPDEEELDEYGLLNSPYVISFFFKTKDENGEDIYIQNFVDISEKQEDGLYYAYSSNYDMIVSVGESSFNFLEWDETYWYYENYIQLSISNIDSILIESPAFSTEFEIEDSASKYLGYVAQSGSRIIVGDKEYRISRGDDGRYVLMSDGVPVEPLYSGDHLMTPVVYTLAEDEADNFIFSESSEIDLDGDGTNDGLIYYFYDVLVNNGEYYLVAQMVMADYQGNPVSEAKTVVGEIAYSSPYFMTQSGYLFFTSKYSSAGMKIDETYGKKNRGIWGEGNVFITSNGQNVLIDRQSGKWMLIDGLTCGLYLADSHDSRLAERAVEIPAKYDADGKLRRYSEIYYPLTDKLIQYDEERDIIAAYNKLSREWEKITYSDSTIGVWGSGSYYVLDGGISILVDSQTGDWGEVTMLSNPLYIADITADGELLDYTISKEGYSASSQSATAMQNFQELYRYLLSASFEELAELDDQQKAELRALDDFVSGENEACVLKLTVKASDFKGNKRHTVYRFYRYSERRAYLTIETIDGSDSSSEAAYGNFDVLYTFVRKVIEDAEKVVNAEPVYSTDKY